MGLLSWITSELEVFGLLTVPTWLAVTLFAVCSLYLYTIYLNKQYDYLGCGGPTIYPVVGNALEFFTKGFAQRELSWYKTFGKCYRFYETGAVFISMADPSALREVLVKEANNFRNRRNLGRLNDKLLDNMLTVLVDDQWKHVRAELTPTFSTGKLRKMRPLIQATVDVFLKNLAKSVDEDKDIDCQAVFRAFTLDTIIGTAFGVVTDTQENPDDPLIVNAKKLLIRKLKSLKILVFFISPTLFKMLGYSFLDKDMSQFFEKFIDQMIEERQKGQGEYKDFLELALKANEHYVADSSTTEPTDMSKRKGLTMDEIKSQSLLFFIAGFDTTSRVLTFCGYHLAVEEEWQQKLMDEVDEQLDGEDPNYDNTNKLELMDMFVSEVLRMYPPAPRLDRQCAEDITIEGQFVPKGSHVAIPVYAIHYDPDIYPDPRKFDPNRFTAEAKAKRSPYSYLPFGMGPRNCIGMRLAQLEMRMVLAAILQKFRFVRSEKTQVPIELDQFLQPKKGAWVKALPRE